MTLNFHHANLQGRSFKKGENLTGADFSNADIRGVNFTNANLVGANFSHARAGLTPYSLVGLILTFEILAVLSGLIIGYASILPGLIVNLLSQETILARPILLLIDLLILATFIFIIIRQGLGKNLVIWVTVVASLTAIIAYGYSFEIGAEALIGAFVIAATVAGILIGSLAIAVFLSITQKYKALILFTIPFILGAKLGALEGIKGTSDRFVLVSLLLAGIFGIFFLIFSAYIGVQAMAGDKKYSLVKVIATNICAALGTNFQEADLTDADFTAAILPHTDFRKATLKCTCWFQVKELALARFEGTYLEDLCVRQLVISKNGENQDYNYKNLRGLNLKNANLVDASFIGSDLSGATLENADLYRAKLVQTQLYGTDLTSALLTGVYIQDWAISTDIKLDKIRCEYVHMRLPTKENPDPWRKPDNREETFQEGDFSDFMAPIIKTLDLYQQQNIDPRQIKTTFKPLDLYHYQGIDPTAAAIALKQIRDDNPEAELEVIALEGRGEEKIRLQAMVTENANSSDLYTQYFAKYNELKSLPYNDIQALLAVNAEKDETIKVLKEIIESNSQQAKFYVETYTTQGDFIMEQSKGNISINDVKGNVSGVVAGENVSMTGVAIGEISGSVTDTISQLSETTNTDEPNLKELLLQLQNAIETEPDLPNEDKVEALEQVKTLAEAGQKPNDSAIKKSAKTAIKILKGTTVGLSETTKLVKECTKLLPAITTLLCLF